MMEGSVLLSLSESLLLPSCEEIPLESLPASDTISSPKCDMPASEPFISKETVEHTSTYELLLKIYHFPSFLEVAFIDKTYPNALRYLRTNYIRSRLAFMRTSRKTDPFESQSINNFNGYDISQSVDMVCPSLSPHLLLTLYIHQTLQI